MNRNINTSSTLNHSGSMSNEVTTTSKGINKGVMNLAPGWYIAMPSKALGKKPLAIELFAQPLVQNGVS